MWPALTRKRVSIRASLQQRGELAKLYQVVGGYQVSIRASLQQRGERRSQRNVFGFIQFQSAPHFSSEANRES